jgi:hypothetical protein
LLQKEEPMRRLLFSLPLLAIGLAATPAHAVDCSTLTNPVYFQVGDTQVNLMKRVGRALRDNTGHEITLVFTSSGSCTNMGVLYNQTVVTANMQYIPSTLEDSTWTPASPTLPCTPKTGGQLIDVANMIVFPSSCPNSVPPGFVRTFTGPIQGMVMAVPAGSSQTAITFEEAYFVFGFGMAGMVAPWTDVTQLFIRTVTKGTLLSWAAAISVPASKWQGTRFDASTDVVSHLMTASNVEAALGILGVEVYDANRDTLKALAWRAKDQYAAYYPDSTATAHDKKNIRDGHYTAWSPTMWMDVVDANNVPRSGEARYVLDLIANKAPQPDPNFDIVAIEATVGLVPDCAMGVSREYDGGPLSLYRPATSCNCKFDSLVATTNCQTCTDTCSTGVCRGGFCEDH